MHRLLIAGLFWLTGVFSTHALSTVFSITPKDPSGGGQFLFAVTNCPVSNGLSFHVSILPERGEVPVKSDAHLCSANIATNSKSIGPLTPDTQILLKRGQHTATADFVVSNQALSNADTSFVFTVRDFQGPAADFYVVKLRDFTTR